MKWTWSDWFWFLLVIIVTAWIAVNATRPIMELPPQTPTATDF